MVSKMVPSCLEMGKATKKKLKVGGMPFSKTGTAHTLYRVSLGAIFLGQCPPHCEAMRGNNIMKSYLYLFL